MRQNPLEMNCIYMRPKDNNVLNNLYWNVHQNCGSLKWSYYVFSNFNKCRFTLSISNMFTVAGVQYPDFSQKGLVLCVRCEIQVP